ncbi:uncharacterized protein METZ01_LOCUS381971, partial [marine metagenome]
MGMVVGMSVVVTVRMVAVRMRVLAMIVVVRMVMVVMTGCGHDGLEYLVGFLVGDFVALEHLPDGEVVLDEQVAFRELCGEMQVAHLPCSMGGFLRIGISHLEDWFGLLVDDVTLLIGGVKDVAVTKGNGEVEAEFSSVVGLAAPATLGQYATLH